MALMKHNACLCLNAFMPSSQLLFQIGPLLSLPQFKVCQRKFKLYGVNCLNKAMVFRVDAPQGVKNLNNLSSPIFSKRDAIIMF